MFPLHRRIAVALLASVALMGAGVGFPRGWFAAASVGSSVVASMTSSQTSTLDLGSASYAPSITYRKTLADGTGNDQFKIIYADSGTIAASDSVLIDIAGAATDAFGNTITCATMKGIMVTGKSTNTNDIIVGGAKTAAVNFLGTAAGDTLNYVPVGPDGVFLLLRPKTGTTVTAGSRDIIRLKNSAGTSGVGYSLQVLCR